METQRMNPGSCPSKKSGPNPRKMTLQRVLPSLGSLGKGKKQPMERTPKWGVGWGGAGNPCQRCRLRAERLSSTVRGWEPARGSGREQEESHCGQLNRIPSFVEILFWGLFNSKNVTDSFSFSLLFIACWKGEYSYHIMFLAELLPAFWQAHIDTTIYKTYYQQRHCIAQRTLFNIL